MGQTTHQLSKFEDAIGLIWAGHPKIRPKTIHFVQVWVEGSLRSLVVQSLPSAAVVASSRGALTADDYLAQAKALLGKKGSEQEVIRLATQALAIKQNAVAYFYRAYSKDDLGDKQGAITDYNQAIAINPQDANAYNNRGVAKSALGDKQGAIADFNQAIAINPQYANAYYNRGIAKAALGDKQGACLDYKKAISLGNQSTAQWLQSDGGAWCRNMP